MSTPEERSLHGYIAQAQRQGLSQNATMRTLRDAGFSFGNQIFRSAWGEISASRATRGAIADAPIQRMPLPNEITPISGRGPQRYVYRFDVVTRQKNSTEAFTTFFGYQTDKLVTYGEAISAISSQWLTNEQQYDLLLIDIIPAAVNKVSG